MRRIAIAAAVLVAAIGLLHTPLGRPLMRRVGMACPARSVSPEAAEALRMRGVRGLRGRAPAPARPALGLVLDGARAADVQAWAAVRGGACTARQRPSALLTCRGVGVYDEVTFGFAPDGRLVSVATMREGLPGGAAAGAFDEIRRQLAARLDDGGDLVGELAGDPRHVARLQYRFADYLATVTAMNLSGGVALREQYQSARD
jgi:hypothetical protein